MTIDYRIRNIVIASVLAAAAVLLTVIYVTSARNDVATGNENVTVYVPAKDYSVGTAGSTIAGNLEKQTVAHKNAAPEAISNPAQLKGLYLTQPVYRGEQLTLNRFALPKQQGIRAELSGKQRALQVPGTPDQVLAGTLVVGDRVDVVANLKNPKDNTDVKTAVVLRNLRVLETDDGSGSSKLSSGQPEDSVILAVTDSQAQRLYYVMKNGDWALQLRPVKKPADSALVDRHAADRARRRREVTTFVTETRKETLRIVVVGTFESELRGALEAPGSGLEVVAWAAHIPDALPHLASGEVHAILLGAGRDGDSAGAMLESDIAVIRLHTQSPVVLLVPEAHPDLVETAFTAGVDDVLVLPQLPETISFAIRKARETGGRVGAHVPVDPLAKRGRVVTVFSPKGGTGKTVLSTNLAAVLAQRSGQRVLLIDLDLQFGDAAIMLGLDPQRTMHELVQAPGALDAGKLAGYTTRHRSGLDVLAAPMRPEDAELVTETKVLQLLEVAREAYDVVVVDTSPFFYGPMLAVLRQTDLVLMLCGLDVPTLKNVKLSLRTLEMLGLPAREHAPRPQPRQPQARAHDGRCRRGAASRSQLRDPQRCRLWPPPSTAAQSQRSPIANPSSQRPSGLSRTQFSRRTACPTCASSTTPGGAGSRLAASSKGGHHESRRPAPRRPERREQRPTHRAHPGGGSRGSATPRGRTPRLRCFRPLRGTEDEGAGRRGPEARTVALLEPGVTQPCARGQGRRHAGARRVRNSARGGRPRAADRGDHRGHPGLRAARAVPRRRHRDRGDGQRVRSGLRRA